MSTRPRERKCLNCGCTRLTRDQLSSAGDLVCEECGMVQEENPIVSEVQFGESSNGAAVVQGSMVGPNQTRAYSQGSALESKQQTLMNARTQMKKIALEMRIPDYVVNSAVGWFTLALNKNFVKGRRSQNVLAACLYVACRKVRTHHLLIDFSSRAQISVYSLGATFLKLVRLLDITKLEPVDTSLFIQHFAEKLGFGDQTTKVCKDATALAQRMSADWICHGRRPAGIAGACLLLAARMNNFQRSHAEVVAVAHVAEETIQKRLNEFKKTSSAKVTVLGFREAVTDSKYFRDTDAKPPAINRNNEIEKKVQKVLRQRTRTLERFRELAKNSKLLSTLDVVPELPKPGASFPRDAKSKQGNKETEENEQDGEDAEDEGSSILNSIDNICPESLAKSGMNFDGETTSRKQTKPRKKTADSDSTAKQDDGENSSSSDEEINDLFMPKSDENEDDYGFADLPDAAPVDAEDEDYTEPRHRVRNPNVVPQKKSTRLGGRLSSLGGLNSKSISSGHLGSLSHVCVPQTQNEDQDADDDEEREAKEDELLKAILDGGSLNEKDLEKTLDMILKRDKPRVENSVNYKENDDIQKIIELSWPRNLMKSSPTSLDILKKVRDDEELDELDDDDEVNNVKLSPEEIKEKEQMWISINHDFLIAQEKKRLKVEADELAGSASGQYKKRRATTREYSKFEPRKQEAPNRSITPAESSRQMLEKKHFSKKINYDHLPNLFTENFGN